MKYKIGNYILVNNKNKIEFRKIISVPKPYSDLYEIDKPIDGMDIFCGYEIICKTNNLLTWAYL